MYNILGILFLFHIHFLTTPTNAAEQCVNGYTLDSITKLCVVNECKCLDEEGNIGHGQGTLGSDETIVGSGTTACPTGEWILLLSNSQSITVTKGAVVTQTVDVTTNQGILKHNLNGQVTKIVIETYPDYLTSTFDTSTDIFVGGTSPSWRKIEKSNIQNFFRNDATCKLCDSGYTLFSNGVTNICKKNICSCLDGDGGNNGNGIGEVGVNCPVNGAEMCSTCNAGWTKLKTSGIFSRCTFKIEK